VIWSPIKRGDKVDKYAIRSDCGRYTVCRFISDGHWYEAWHGKERLGQDREASIAKSMCERHAEPIPELDLPRAANER